IVDSMAHAGEGPNVECVRALSSEQVEGDQGRLQGAPHRAPLTSTRGGASRLYAH
ncbi:hypothetical protein HAX54_033452, partial [Datura stramonium]|nr:hypothetical protein [Datura stramonium]